MEKIYFNMIDTTKEYYWLNSDARNFLKQGYLYEGVEPEKRYRDIAERAEKILKIKGFADKFESYIKKGWYSLSSPIISNFGLERGLPISCNNSVCEDSMDSILEKVAEVGMMTKYGAGTSIFVGDLRARGSKISVGGKSSGSVHFLELFESVVNVISQSNVRRGSCAAYLPIEHDDIKEFLKIKSDGHPIQHLSIGITITDKWMNDMIDGDKDKRGLWAKVIQKRCETGYPYILFSDTVNKHSPKAYKDKGLKIKSSNLCSEILLYSSPKESFVCNLSSLNLLHWEDWKDTDAIETLTYFLDAVMSEYIDKVKDIPFMKSAYNFAVNQRALGIGTLGWHSYLQSKMIPFESIAAKLLNSQIYKIIQDKTFKASSEMSEIYGEPPLLKGYGMRNVTTMAIAPTTSSSFILGQVSPSIEPLNSNYFVKDLAKGKFTYRNPYLEELLIQKDKNNQETWKSILVKGGSVQHLTFLTQEEKDIFKTFGEISQKEIIIQASQRQKYIDQGQSLNLMIPHNVSVKDINQLLIEAWKLGIKTLYYQRSTNPAQELSRSILECKSCEA
jgi:ribonucleoside-diphosphate reductase alpha chain